MNDIELAAAFGRFLRGLREERGLTETDVREGLDLPVELLREIEGGGRVPMRELGRLLRFYGGSALLEFHVFCLSLRARRTNERPTP